MSLKPALTDRQREVFEFIRSRSSEIGLPPTVREIGQAFSISSTNGVRSILSALIKKGYIRRSPKLSRGIEILHQEKENSSTSSNMIDIPILGRVAAGSPILAVQNLEGTVSVDRDFLMRQENVFALKVQGNSMKNAGILDGDLVFARQQKTAEKGQIIVARIGEEATVKYFYPEQRTVRLEPANESFRPIMVSPDKDFSIAGRVIGVMRKI